MKLQHTFNGVMDYEYYMDLFTQKERMPVRER
jgi:hypothetical protein